MGSPLVAHLRTGTVEYRVTGPESSPHPPVLFVHGVAVDGRMWEPVAALLAAAGYRSVLPTLPLGAHHIPWGPAHDRSPRGAAALVRELVTELGLTDATLVGCDTGGAICQFALDADPDFVGRVVFTNCDAFDQFPPQPFRLIFALLRRRRLLRPLIAGPMQVRALRHSPICLGLLVTNPDAEYTRSVFEPLRTDPAIRDDFVAFLDAIDRTELAGTTPRLSRLTIPVSVVWGADDKAFRPELGRRLAAVFGQATFTAVPGARTFVALDRPQAVVDAVVAGA